MLELLLGLVDGPDPLHNILLKLLNLILESLLVLFILLLMLSLDDLLSLFSDSVKLDILSSFLEIFNFQIKSFLDELHSLKVCFEL